MLKVSPALGSQDGSTGQSSAGIFGALVLWPLTAAQRQVLSALPLGSPLTPSWLLEFLPRLLLPFPEDQTGRLSPASSSWSSVLPGAPLVWILPAYRQGKGGLPASTTLAPPGWKLSFSVNVEPPPIAGVSGRTGGPVSRGESGETVPQVEPQGQAVLGDTSTLAASRSLLIAPFWA